MLQALARSIVRDLDEFELFLYAGNVPPVGWEGGRGRLCPWIVAGRSMIDTFCTGAGSSSGRRREGGWMMVGRGPMRVMELQFVQGC